MLSELLKSLDSFKLESERAFLSALSKEELEKTWLTNGGDPFATVAWFDSNLPRIVKERLHKNHVEENVSKMMKKGNENGEKTFNTQKRRATTLASKTCCACSTDCWADRSVDNSAAFGAGGGVGTRAFLR